MIYAQKGFELNIFRINRNIWIIVCIHDVGNTLPRWAHDILDIVKSTTDYPRIVVA